MFLDPTSGKAERPCLCQPCTKDFQHLSLSRGMPRLEAKGCRSLIMAPLQGYGLPYEEEQLDAHVE